MNKMKRIYILNSFNSSSGECIFFNPLHRKQNEARLWDYLGDFTQVALAKYLKVNRVHLSNVLNGKVQLTLKMAYKIAEVCDVSIDRIYQIEKELGLIK